MQENAPFFKRLRHDLPKFVFTFDNNKCAPTFWLLQGFCQIACLNAAAVVGAIKVEHLFYGKAIYYPLKIFISINRKCAFALEKHLFAWNAFYESQLLFWYAKREKVSV